MHHSFISQHGTEQIIESCNQPRIVLYGMEDLQDICFKKSIFLIQQEIEACQPTTHNHPQYLHTNAKLVIIKL
jgi:hypothetical protein